MQVTFQSSATDKTYKVTVNAGVAKCTCPDFIYRREAKGEWCKHIVALLGEKAA